MSEVKTNKLTAATGTAITLGDSGDTFTVPSGATLAVASGGTITNSGTATGFGGNNTPAFQAYISANVTINHDTATKITFNTEDFDTDNAYDNTTNYRFTVPTDEGGKYFFSAHTIIGALASSQFNYGYQYIHKNGSGVAWSAVELRANPGEYITLPSTVILTLVPTDYVEVFCWVFTTNSSAGRALAFIRGSRFTGFKMIGI